jgi:Co/Zn/Cd efflux system component
MGIGTSILLIAVGAILRYAVTVTVSEIELQTVGLILMIVGIIGLVISLAVIFMANDDRPRRTDDSRLPTGQRELGRTGLRGRLRRRRPSNLTGVMPAKGR